MKVNGASTIVVNTITVHQAGTTITNDAQALQKDITNMWVDYNSETGVVPAMCLRNDFDTFRSQQEPLTSKAIENRITIGQTLAKAAALLIVPYIRLGDNSRLAGEETSSEGNSTMGRNT